MSIDQDLKKLKQALAGQDDRAQAFNPPATARDFEELERVTGVTVPEELRALWSLANGAETDATAFNIWIAKGRFEAQCDFLSVAQSIELWKMAHDFEGDSREPERSDKVKNGWFRKGWIPFASYNVSSVVAYCDTDPSPSGSVGQVIVCNDDPSFVQWHSGSLGEFLKQARRKLPSE